MTKSKTLHFIANARLKDIVGRGLINNDNIAIIELIKNSKDAGSPNVAIDFYAIRDDELESQIYITDKGRGMSLDDIEFKWLNIAYSEKKNTTPKSGGAYAGSKGIGRFSCDRLGETLFIYTRVKGGQYITLELDWSKFEVDDRETQIGHIKTEARYISPSVFENETGVDQFEHGTLLIIQNLRTDWTLDRLRSLRRELERFVIDPEQKFDVSISHHRYKDTHEINQPIENKIFEDLDFRTTSIIAEVGPEGTEIKISLRHDGDFVFRTIEYNPYSALRSIRASIFFLNQPAKAFFKRRTGYHSVNYGSVFLFLNGFRVFPYGSEGDDWLGFDRRSQQGQRRFFGTRDLVGYIEVTDKNDCFTPVSSREGLVENQAYHELTSANATVKSSIDKHLLFGFVHKLSRKLEKFVVEGLDWDRIKRSQTIDENDLLAGDYEYLETPKPVLETIDSIIKIRSPQDHIKDIDINLRYLGKLAEQEVGQYSDFVEALEKKFDSTPINKLRPSEKRDLSKFISRQAKELAVKNSTNTELEVRKERAEKALATEEKRRLFAEFENTADQERILQLHHQVSLIAGSLWKRLEGVTRQYRIDPSLYTKEDLFGLIESGLYEITRIQNVAKLASKADFDLMTNKVKEDLIQFIQEYLYNFIDILHAWSLRVNFRNPNAIHLLKTFRPIELTILIDNLLVNAGKSGAKLVTIDVTREGSTTVIMFADNGDGLSDRFEPKDLFEKGISTTSGSGIGLNHARRIVNDLNGQISIENGKKHGAVIRLEFGLS